MHLAGEVERTSLTRPENLLDVLHLNLGVEAKLLIPMEPGSRVGREPNEIPNAKHELW